MKKILVITGTIVFLSLSLRVIGIFVEFPFNNFLLYLGLVLLALVFVPLLIFYTYKEEKNIDNVLKSRRFSKKEHFEDENQENGQSDVENINPFE